MSDSKTTNTNTNLNNNNSNTEPNPLCACGCKQELRLHGGILNKDGTVRKFIIYHHLNTGNSANVNRARRGPGKKKSSEKKAIRDLKKQVKDLTDIVNSIKSPVSLVGKVITSIRETPPPPPAPETPPSLSPPAPKVKAATDIDKLKTLLDNLNTIQDLLTQNKKLEMMVEGLQHQVEFNKAVASQRTLDKTWDGDEHSNSSIRNETKKDKSALF